MHLLWFLFSLICASTGAPFPQSSCPSDCECLTLDMVTTTRCSSLAFIHDAPAEHLNKVSHLDVSHTNLTKIATVRKLHGLKSLNMAHNDIRQLGDLTSLSKLSMLNICGNKLKTLDEHQLPKQLEHLDVSANHLADFPKFDQLKHLKAVNLAGNPFMCSCELKSKFEDLQKVVTLVKPVTCRDGSGHVRAVPEFTCSGFRNQDQLGHNDLQNMQNDMEGSGEESVETEENQTDIFAKENLNDSKKLAELQNEELLPTASTKVPELNKKDYEDNGDEDEHNGSGHSEYTPENENIYKGAETPLKACNLNCTPITFNVPESTSSSKPHSSLKEFFKEIHPDSFSGYGKEDVEPSSDKLSIEAPMNNLDNSNITESNPRLKEFLKEVLLDIFSGDGVKDVKLSSEELTTEAPMTNPDRTSSITLHPSSKKIAKDALPDIFLGDGKEDVKLSIDEVTIETPINNTDTTNSIKPHPSRQDFLKEVLPDIFSDVGEDKDVERSSDDVTTEASMTSVVIHKSKGGRSGDGIIPVVIHEQEKVYAAEDSEASEVKQAGNLFEISNNMNVAISPIIVMVCIIIYIILAKRKKTNRHPQILNDSTAPGQELKVIKPTKPPRQSLLALEKTTGILEKVLLMNGQNETAASNSGQHVPDANIPLINEPECKK